MHRQFWRKSSQKPEYVKSFWNDSKIFFNFACRRWVSYNQTN